MAIMEISFRQSRTLKKQFGINLPKIANELVSTLFTKMTEIQDAKEDVSSKFINLVTEFDEQLDDYLLDTVGEETLLKAIEYIRGNEVKFDIDDPTQEEEIEAEIERFKGLIMERVYAVADKLQKVNDDPK